MTSHDACVASWAKAYKDKEWTVHADIQGYLDPPEINKKIPDIYAKSGNNARVLEVEPTSPSILTMLKSRLLPSKNGRKRALTENLD